MARPYNIRPCHLDRVSNGPRRIPAPRPPKGIGERTKTSFRVHWIPGVYVGTCKHTWRQGEVVQPAAAPDKGVRRMVASFKRRTAVATTCAISALAALSLAPAAMAGKPAPPPPPPPPPPPSTTATAYSGEAQVVQADLSALLGTIEAHVAISKAGPLPATGGMDHASLIDVGANSPLLYLGAHVASASTAASGNRSHSSASVADVSLGVGVLPATLLRVSASVLRSSAVAKCGANGAELTGRSDIVKLKLAVGDALFADVLVTSAPNQVINVAGIAVIHINEQVVTANSIDVNALRIELNADQGLGTLLNPIVNGNIVISRSHADITCQGGGTEPPCQVKDWVTGGGQIGDEKASFGMNGGNKPNGLTGHFNLVDKASGVHLKAGTVTDYAVLSPTERRVTYSGTQDGAPFIIVVGFAYNGEGANATGPDTISVTTTGGYSIAGDVGGQIQLHMPASCNPPTSTKPQGKPK